MIINLITQMEAGGAQGAAIRNAKKFIDKGLNSEVWFLYKKRGVYEDLDFTKSILNREPNNIFDYFYIIFKLAIMLLRMKNVKLICYTHYANIIGGIVGRLCFVKRVVVSHRNPVDTYPKMCKYVDLIIGCLGFYSSCIVVSKTVLDSFRDYPKSYKKRLKLIYNGIELNVSNKPEREFSTPTQFTITTTGRLHPQKNQVVIIKAMLLVDKAKLIIAGDGELFEELSMFVKDNKLEDRVYFKGEISPNEVNDLLCESDLFLFPSNYEAFGFSVVEAMAAGLPIICSDIPAMREIVSDSGIIVDKDDVNAWAENINYLLNTPNKRSELSKKALERAKLFSLENMTKGYLNEL